MIALLRFEAETLPRVLVLDPPMSEAEFETFCRENDNVQFERTKEGAIRLHPPAGGYASDGSREITYQLSAWWAKHERGRAFDSSGGFRLPDGSMHSPDASYLSEERSKKLPKGGLRSFPRVCPDFVVELVSDSDAVEELKKKMMGWISNGALLGWLIDPYERQVLVYRPGHKTQRLTGYEVTGGR